MPSRDALHRLSVVGATGSGKTTVAGAIGARLGIPVAELDAIHWGPDWTPIDRTAIREQVSAIVATDAWVIDGTGGRRRTWWGRPPTRWCGSISRSGRTLSN